MSLSNKNHRESNEVNKVKKHNDIQSTAIINGETNYNSICKIFSEK